MDIAFIYLWLGPSLVGSNFQQLSQIHQSMIIDLRIRTNLNHQRDPRSSPKILLRPPWTRDIDPWVGYYTMKAIKINRNKFEIT